ncbi:protein of unknown function DUF1615 [Gallionella capsiferriformans ES-2]|uniref:DUF1615 domain-containing protein n=1 Tax=Gallionella capsiferriformans (strain ES-2) TaxID=395494 RepID=D9SJB6_GALCS|nr:protein of unknown function DUF1615 [Gallionella capsiferriformans ES-2]
MFCSLLSDTGGALNVNTLRRTGLLILISLSGCASTPEPVAEAPVVQSQSAKIKPPPVAPAPKKAPVPPSVVIPAAKAPPASEKEVHELLMRLLPARLKDKAGWADDLQSAYKALQIPPTPEYFCATLAVIEQESSFQADPVVLGLPAIIRREIVQRSEKYSIPQTVIDWMLSSNSRDGRSFSQRIDALKTEKELSDLIEEIIAMLPAGRELFPNYNPVHTGGPMQVSVEFAESHVRARPYPYPLHGNLRNEVFSRRGGVYFGSAILLDYPAPYTDMLYRFADFNAGRYSSRNAAFQRALSRASGQPLAPDGDLLRYKNGNPSTDASATLKALLTLNRTLKLSEAELQRDLRLEKLSSFSRTPLYQRLYALADQNGTQPRVALPQIDLKSPKIKRKLTTEWFANRVNSRYKNCLQQKGSISADSKTTKSPGGG